MAQQTAVEWLLSELQIRLLKIKSEPNGIERERMINSFLIDAEQAEQMEKEQLEQLCIEVAEEAKKILKEELKGLLVLPNPYNK